MNDEPSAPANVSGLLSNLDQLWAKLTDEANPADLDTVYCLRDEMQTKLYAGWPQLRAALADLRERVEAVTRERDEARAIARHLLGLVEDEWGEESTESAPIVKGWLT